MLKLLNLFSWVKNKIPDHIPIAYSIVKHYATQAPKLRFLSAWNQIYSYIQPNMIPTEQGLQKVTGHEIKRHKTPLAI